MTEPDRYPTAEAAEQAFYDAIERKDLAAMAGVWSRSADSECIHPMGERLRGHRAILQSWAQIFADPARMRFRLAERRSTQAAGLTLHTLHELISVDRGAAVSRMIATNAYVLEDGSWRMLLHHASPAPRPQSAPTRVH